MTTAPETWRPLKPSDAGPRETLRAALAPRKGALRGPGARGAYDALIERIAPAAGVSYAPEELNGIPGWWCVSNAADPGRTILYLHGGWFVLGSARAYRNFAGHIAARSKAAAFVPDYRLAPEYPVPAAVNDVRRVYDGLTERGVRHISVVGDSAGGALALGLLAALARERGTVQPAAGALLSPVTDLTLSGASWGTRDSADLLFTKEQVQEMVSLYLGDRSPADPQASPLNADVRGLPPLRIDVGNDEMLLDDSRRFAQRAVEAGVDVRLNVWEGMQHVFPAAIDAFKAARTALDEIGAFLVAHRPRDATIR